MNRGISILVLISAILSDSLRAEVPTKIRVGILSKFSPNQIRILAKRSRVISGTETIFRGDSDSLIRGEGDRLSFIRENSRRKSDQILFSGGEYDIFLPGSESPRKYAGDLEIRSKEGILKFILTVPRESYVDIAFISEFGELMATKVASGAAKNWKREFEISGRASVRSYALANLGRHSKEGHDVCDLTHCLQFSGLPKRNANEPTSAPNLIILDGKNKPLETFFHASCGGHLSSPKVLWRKFGENFKFFRSGPDRWKGEEILCRNSPHFEWETFIEKEDMENILKAKRISSLSPISEEGRVAQIVYSDSEGKHTANIAEFLSSVGKRLGWNKTKSNDFTIESGTNGYHFKGRGFGHGIGLCQYGAREMAFRGATYNEILNFYFPGVRIEVLP
ncbi:sporulation protein [Leptospira wolffii]|uniref:Sporulation protein n=2 Tax=Leptospira wolffii TaxID=409998 RepID=A0A2M9ZF88_9LEPT|nr:sporulation protein [Leptospira wolffii]